YTRTAINETNRPITPATVVPITLENEWVDHCHSRQWTDGAEDQQRARPIYSSSAGGKRRIGIMLFLSRWADVHNRVTIWALTSADGGGTMRIFGYVGIGF